VLIVNYNGKSILRDLLNSIAENRGGLTVETIVVDNDSADGSADMVAGEFPEVVLDRSDRNLGFARGNNRAAKQAGGELILLLNNDTRVLPGAIEALVQFMREHPEAVAAGPTLLGGDGLPQKSGRNLPTVGALLNGIQFLKWTGVFRGAYRRYRRVELPEDRPAVVAQLAAAALVIRRTAFEACGGFDEGFEFGVEDVDLCKRLAEIGAIYHVPAARIEHLGRVSSRANRGFVYRGYECGWARYLRKHHGAAAAWLYKILVTADMPVRLGVLSLQWMAQKLSGRAEKSERTAGIMRAAAEFAATGLPAFWRA
jgi:N-acetylglucosaminyl-diphospho-decaprenol L-rhamnosyltransferase